MEELFQQTVKLSVKELFVVVLSALCVRVSMLSTPMLFVGMAVFAVGYICFWKYVLASSFKSFLKQGRTRIVILCVVTAIVLVVMFWTDAYVYFDNKGLFEAPAFYGADWITGFYSIVIAAIVTAVGCKK